ncbi:hypothetical protein [Rubritalea marina]|uniref:hypothetical protein n=1 Tax=Rubritalea marina TaxID=361055 RepID=UPI000475B4DA|nr:hypothetical protein [Rubritalea marina]
MHTQLEQVVPLGHSLGQYQRMFKLTEDDLNKKLLGVADGPSSFNAELTAAGGQVTSIDPIYAYTGEEIESQFQSSFDPVRQRLTPNPQDWDWSFQPAPGLMQTRRTCATRSFVDDFKLPSSTDRYKVGELPQLPVNTAQFDIAVCSHFLFFYSDQLSFQFHIDAINEMLRVAREVRIFPLTTLMLNVSPYIEGVLLNFITEGYEVLIEESDYTLVDGYNRVMTIRHKGFAN